MLNGVPFTQSHEHYNYRAYLESLQNYGTDAATSHLPLIGTLITVICSLGILLQRRTSATNDGFIARWSRLSGSRDVQLFGCLRTDLCNVPLLLQPKVFYR